MKKLLAILAIATFLCSCSAEKRLANLLKHHPELHHIDTLLIHDTVILPADTNAILLSLTDLIAMDSAASAAQTEDKDPVANPSTSAEVSGDRSSAALQALGDGKFILSTTAPADTIIVRDTVYTPSYVTETEEKEVIVYQQTWWQQGLSFIGGILLIIIIIWLIIKIVLKFVKPI